MVANNDLHIGMHYKNWICFIWAFCLSLSPTIGFFYYPVIVVSGIYINTIIFVAILAFSIVLQNRLNPKFNLILLLLSLIMIFSFLLMLMTSKSNIANEIQSSFRLLAYFLLFIILCTSKISLGLYLKIREIFAKIIVFYSFLALALILLYGLPGYLEINRNLVEILGQDSDIFYGGTTLGSSIGEFLRPTFPGINSNTTVYLLIFAFIYFAYQVVHNYSFIYVFISGCLFIFIALTLSRQGILFLGLASLVVLVDLFKANKKIALAMLLTGMSMISTIIYFYPIVLYRTLQPIFLVLGMDYDSGLNTSNRFESINDSLSIIINNPTGIGVNGYSMFLGSGVSAEHNLLIYLSITMGILLSISLVLIMLTAIFRVFSKNLGPSDPLALSIIRLDLFILTISILFSPNYAFFLIFLALILCASRNKSMILKIQGTN